MWCFVEILIPEIDALPEPMQIGDWEEQWEHSGEGASIGFFESPEFIEALIERLQSEHSRVLFRTAHVYYGPDMAAEAYTNDMDSEFFPEKYFFEGDAICFKDTYEEAIEFLNESLDILDSISNGEVINSEADYLTTEDIGRMLRVPVKRIESFKDIEWIEEDGGR